MNTEPASPAPLIAVEDLHVAFTSNTGRTLAVDGISFSLSAGEIVAIVGESGSGKSITALTLTRLLEKDLPVTIAGKVIFEGQDLLNLPNRSLRRIRGNEIAYVFQDPGTTFNPVFSIEKQMGEVLKVHGKKPNRQHLQSALEDVGIPDPARKLKQYPHEFSGGQLQRVLIAMALLCQPKLLIADEPTTSLDASTQLQILHLLKQLRNRHQLAILFITHHLGILQNFADRILVMNQGKIVESGTVAEVLKKPKQPYTRKLIASIPRIGSGVRRLGVAS
jgi:ABC-type dipeptide/oligopeptide/nickel transport system ATPase component